MLNLANVLTENAQRIPERVAVIADERKLTYHEVETLEFSISVGFTFAGGTSTSQFATMAERFKQSMGDTPGVTDNPGQDLPNIAALQQQLAADPAMLMKLMSSPEVQKMLSDPAMLQSLQAMMSPGKKK